MTLPQRPPGGHIDVEAEAMALPADILAAAEAIEGSATFREHFTPARPLGRLHPVAAEFGRLAAYAIAHVPDAKLQCHEESESGIIFTEEGSP